MRGNQKILKWNPFGEFFFVVKFDRNRRVVGVGVLENIWTIDLAEPRRKKIVLFESALTG